MSYLENAIPGFLRDGERHTDALIVLLQNLSKLHVRLHRQKIIEHQSNPPSSSSNKSRGSSRATKTSSTSKAGNKKKTTSNSRAKTKKGSSTTTTSSSSRQRSSRMAHIVKALKLVDRSLLKGIRLLTPRALSLTTRRVSLFRIMCQLLRKSDYSATLIRTILISMNRWIRNSAQCRLEDKLRRHQEVSNFVPSRVRSEILGLSQNVENIAGVLSSEPTISSTGENEDSVPLIRGHDGFEPLSPTEIYGFAHALFASHRLLDNHPSLLQDFLDVTMSLIAEYDRDGDEVLSPPLFLFLVHI